CRCLVTGWLPVALFGLHRYVATAGRRWLVLFAVSYVFQVLSNTYMAYLMALPIAIVVADALWRDRARRTRLLLEFATACALVAVVLAPGASSYYDVRV